MKKIYLLLSVLLCTVFYGQEKIETGSFKNLKKISAYNVVFDYSGIKVDQFDTEEDFLKNKMDKRTEDKAQEFKKHWFEDREAVYEPKFITYFNERMEGKVSVAKQPEAAYTILVKTTWLYPGYNVVVVEQVAKISAVITVYETANPQNILLKVRYDESRGIAPRDDAHKPAYRIAGAYEKLAKNFTMQLKRYIR